jgi:hypothetical protein
LQDASERLSKTDGVLSVIAWFRQLSPHSIESRIGIRMSDPNFANISMGFTAFGIAVFLWASFDYNRFIKFWMHRPAPYSQRVKITFRLFFLACVVGCVWQLVETMTSSPRPALLKVAAFRRRLVRCLFPCTSCRGVDGAKAQHEAIESAAAMTALLKAC